jgi:hypothetical protein
MALKKFMMVPVRIHYLTLTAKTCEWNQASPTLNTMDDFLASCTGSINLFYYCPRSSVETYCQEDTAFPFKAILRLASMCDTSFNADSSENI